MNIGETLQRTESALAAGSHLGGTGFWRAVAALRKDPGLAAQHAERVGAIDRLAFERTVRLRVPVWVGAAALLAGTAAGVAGLVLAGRLEGTARDLLFVAAFGALDIAPHSLAHFVVGALMGMKFTHFFLGGPPPPRPGAKVDYATYLRVPARKRALMHASGALVTKITPFALVPVAMWVGVSKWIYALLLIAGLVQIITDVLFSTKTSDWKRARREWRAAKSAVAGG